MVINYNEWEVKWNYNSISYGKTSEISNCCVRTRLFREIGFRDLGGEIFYSGLSRWMIISFLYEIGVWPGVVSR